MPTRYIEVCSKKTHRKHYVLVYHPARESGEIPTTAEGNGPHRVHLDDGRPLRWTQEDCFEYPQTNEEFAPVARDLEARVDSAEQRAAHHFDPSRT